MLPFIEKNWPLVLVFVLSGAMLLWPLLQRRRDKEASALSSLQHVMQRIGDLRTLHRWMYAEHNAYTALGWMSRRSSAPELVEIY